MGIEWRSLSPPYQVGNGPADMIILSLNGRGLR
jgi:hypothetical protein